MKKKSFSQKILFNNQIMLIFSVVISLAIWVYMSTGTSNDTVVTVNDVPIQVALPDEAANAGLQTFFENSQTAYASVTVSGNRKLLGSISKDDFIVTANASNVDHADTYNLPVSADKKSTINNTFQITNCTPSKITVEIDTESKKDFKLLPKFKYSAKNDYYASVTYNNDTVTITGPSEKVRVVSKVCAVTDDMENLESSKDFHASIVLYDENDNELSKNYLTLSATSVDGTVNVSPKKTVDVKATFANKPQDFDVTDDIVTIDPKRVSIAGFCDLCCAGYSEIASEYYQNKSEQDKQYHLGNSVLFSERSRIEGHLQDCHETGCCQESFQGLQKRNNDQKPQR